MAYATWVSGREIRSLMRKHKVTIRELKERTGITMKRIREVRAKGIEWGAGIDWKEAIFGEFTEELRAEFRAWKVWRFEGKEKVG